MRSIVLIATRHSNSGLCNSDELFRIIANVAPDVIFEEIPADKFKAVYESPVDLSLETSAIKQYKQYRSIQHFPVDLVIDRETETFFRGELSFFDALFCYESQDYFDLRMELNKQTKEGGFPYLNGEECALLLNKRRNLEEHILKQRNDHDLTQRYCNWSKFVEHRENEMLKNIYNYNPNDKYEKGLFLVGAEHRQPMIDKVKAIERRSEQEINWIFDYY